jgi:hypothetical protein
MGMVTKQQLKCLPQLILRGMRGQLPLKPAQLAQT